MTPAPLACTVRGCGLLLEPAGRTIACARGHSYDRARGGYVNLLQPQDRRSTHAGDAKEAVEARARLLDAGIGRAIVNGVVQRAVSLALPPDAVVVDLGAGSGDVLGALAAARPITGVGVDLSTAAAELAARRFPALIWVVANADRGIPLLDRTVDLVLSVHGRRQPSEAARVLARTGFMLVTVPAHDDLIELRESVQGRGVERDRGDTLVDEHADRFTLVDRSTLAERLTLAPPALRDLLRSTYRGGRVSAAARIDALEAMEVTLASDVLVFARR